MWETSGRLLHLLSLLQRRRDWNADALGRELSITTRTVRRDVARLRELGYPVSATHGNGGGYRLEAGAALPPLMFDSDEAVSTVLALRSFASHGSEESTSSVLSALDKLTRVMPKRLRATIAALADHSSEVDMGILIAPSAPDAELKSLVTLSRACREEHQVLCQYSGKAGPEVRRLEPLGLVRTLGRWYLVAYCLTRGDWRTFRVDRLSDIEPTRRPSTHRTPPDGDLADYVRQCVRGGYRQVTAAVLIHAPVETIRHWIMPAWGTLVPESPTTSRAEVGADSFEAIARWLLLADAPITVLDPPELLTAFHALGERCRSIAGGDLPLPAQQATGRSEQPG